ncbi:MAG: glycoside hydrolase family 88 protein [Clostridiaceae bacterium]|nr:glycoside hydrolase family 88 protein [Clostridiaceae bacterium]
MGLNLSRNDTVLLSPEHMDVSLNAACHWLTDKAQMKTERLTHEKNSKEHNYKNWKGAIKGEYSAFARQWDFYCPVWHTGQAVKALVQAYRLTEREEYLKAAREGSRFIYRHQVWEKGNPLNGLILAYENTNDLVYTSAILECMDGLMELAELEHDENAWERIILAAEFIIRYTYQQNGLFWDAFSTEKGETVVPNHCRVKQGCDGRPLLDDGIFCRLYKKTGDLRYKQIARETAECLIKEQNPPGNWIDFSPCKPEKGFLHPRHTYWWGMPLLDVYELTKDPVYLENALTSGRFTRKMMRIDGGMMRGTNIEFNTESFGHAASGSACAAIFFMRLYEKQKQTEWLEAAGNALCFCMEMQISETEDPNLQGVIVEKVLPPCGSDRLPYQIRDIGTIFYIQAAVKYIEMMKREA